MIWRLSLVAAMLALATPAKAFTVESAFSDGCHEQIAEAALRNVRTTLSTAQTIAPTSDERALIDDLPFTVPDDMSDLASVTFLMGIRDNDLKGHAPTELEQMAVIQGDPTLQHEHCLREPGDVEPGGSAAALARCSAFILERAMSAVSTLTAAGVPDPTIRDELAVSLSVRGDVTASLPAFWVRIGQAMHALQDAFAHTYRTSDGGDVTVVLDWVDLVDNRLNESIDGPPHKIQLDHCNAGDAIRSRNKAQAVVASTALLQAVLDPTLTNDQKSTQVQAVLASSLAYVPGCTFDNAWCDAPENAYTQLDVCGCRMVGARGLSITAGVFGLLFVAAVLRRRRRMALLVLPAAFLLMEPVARADEPQHVAIALDFAGSPVDPAVAGSLGVRVPIGQHFIVGVDVELNDFYGLNGSHFDVGSTNIYAVGIVRYPMLQRFALRTTFNLGAAIEVADLYGVPSGSWGFFVGLYPLGVEWRVAQHVYVVFNPLGFAIPVTHFTGAVWGYPQFRTQLGVELAF